MLAPGDYLIQPPPEGQPAGQGAPPTPTECRPEPNQNPTPATGAKEAEPRSFLLTLLRALGAIHT